MSNVIPIPNRHAINRILEKIVAGQPLNPMEKSLLRCAATQQHQQQAWPGYEPEQENMNEPAA